MAELEEQKPVSSRAHYSIHELLPETSLYHFAPPGYPCLVLANPKGARPTLGRDSLPVKFLSDVNSQTAWPLSTTLARSLSLALLCQQHELP